MNISVNPKLLRTLKQFHSDKEAWENRFEDKIRYSSDEDFFQIDIADFNEDELKQLEKEAEKTPTGKYRGLLKKLTLYKNISKEAGGAIVKKLDSLSEAIRIAFKKLPNKWLFQESTYMLPYVITDIEYEPYEPRNQIPASTTVTMHYAERGEKQSRHITFHSTDLIGEKTVLKLFAERGFFPETEKLVKEYQKDVEKYRAIHHLTGKQFNAVGFARVIASSWSSSDIGMVRDGVATKVVMDDLVEGTKKKRDDDDEDNEGQEREEGSLIVDASLWRDGGSREEAERASVAPLHPYVQVFDLSKHQHVIIHVADLEPYKYDTTLKSKLILPKHKKELVDILIQGTLTMMDDIVKGKTGGIIVLATGMPGTGKTLTAEVYSETIQKPLYIVQCSQLGINAEELEQKLTATLARAARWGAILLIDEADVYVYERGRDITQNAIVGVFLRVLEYYRGVLFLTSNRETIIDDAILSRTTAHIKYELPSKGERVEIWKVLAEQFKVKLSSSLIEEFAEKFQNTSGRAIKSLLKLSKLLSEREKKPISFDLVKYASNFLDGVDALAAKK